MRDFQYEVIPYHAQDGTSTFWALLQQLRQELSAAEEKWGRCWSELIFGSSRADTTGLPEDVRIALTEHAHELFQALNQAQVMTLELELVLRSTQKPMP